MFGQVMRQKAGCEPPRRASFGTKERASDAAHGCDSPIASSVAGASSTSQRSPAQVRQFVFPPQKYLFPEGEADNTLIDVAYTLVRPGPCVECHRVGGCDAAGQGCRTKALLPYRTTCHRLAAEIDNTRS